MWDEFHWDKVKGMWTRECMYERERGSVCVRERERERERERVCVCVRERERENKTELTKLWRIIS